MSKIVGQKSGHPLDAEELMAYLDGELSQSRAAVAAAHLGQCAEWMECAWFLRKLGRGRSMCRRQAWLK